MSKTLEEIITSPSLVRENWLPTELAVREVLAFERRFGLRHLKLACHAALPLILSPELVNLIHLNFLEGEGIPWVAEVDLLLSPLCRPVDEGLYEVEPAIREVLLVELENQFGWERPFTLAKFLEFYLARKSGLKLRPQIIQTQRWIAQAYLNPDLVVQEMTHLLESSLSEENHILGLSEQIQVTNTVELLAEPLERTNYHEEYQYLTDNSKVLSEIFYGDEQKLKEKIQQEQAEGEIREEELRQLAPSVLRQLGISRESREEKFKDLFSLELPAWLQECLSAYQSDSGQDKSEDNDLICRAFNFAYQLHRGQYCKSGKPYITHPIAVAGLLRDLGGSSTIIAAGFLHDVVEDTEVTPEEIEARFGVEVRNLVEAVTKLSKYNFSSKTERQAENFRRMFLAMAQDIRVIVVKLAERLHNMQTLEYLNPQQQQRIALETREIFAPLANCLGIERFKWELEDLCFKYLEPDAYRTVQLLVSEKRIDREARIETVTNTLREKLQEIGIKVLDLQGRPKHLYGIYHKMHNQGKEFEQIYDIAAVRIIVETKEECYRCLAVVHDQFTPIPNRFKDYIGLPKANRYQSLHTTVVGLNARPLEVQIRTLEMHHFAEYGDGSELTSDDKKKFQLLRQRLDWRKEFKDIQEYWKYVNSLNNLFDDDVYVFNLQGDVIFLAQGSTPVDFAYCIHTEVGHRVKGAKVNGRWTTLDYPLENGDFVEIVTSKNSHPSLDWLNFVVTPNARKCILEWYKQSRMQESVRSPRKRTGQ
ncbi:GTP pyrophosphokinase [Microcystis aeruginosa NIES-4285]|uniref:GTP pyrophosphokinase n=1 Tax=Microcystis aeruginosa NIES-4285 TaxID=2497681 RepID=A0A402DKN4_MICAE|nr:GTP pyrophosphokinase [Microcystis aeruginosa NIES-4285]